MTKEELTKLVVNLVDAFGDVCMMGEHVPEELQVNAENAIMTLRDTTQFLTKELGNMKEMG